LTKSPTGIGQITNQYWPNHQPVLAKSPTGIGEIVYWFILVGIIFFVQEIFLKIPHRFTKLDEDPIPRTKFKVPLVDILNKNNSKNGLSCRMLNVECQILREETQ